MENNIEEILKEVEVIVRENNGDVVVDSIKNFRSVTRHLYRCGIRDGLILATVIVLVGTLTGSVIIPKIEELVHNHKKKHN